MCTPRPTMHTQIATHKPKIRFSIHGKVTHCQSCTNDNLAVWQTHDSEKPLQIQSHDELLYRPPYQWGDKERMTRHAHKEAKQLDGKIEEGKACERLVGPKLWCTLDLNVEFCSSKILFACQLWFGSYLQSLQVMVTSTGPGFWSRGPGPAKDNNFGCKKVNNWPTPKVL